MILWANNYFGRQKYSPTHESDITKSNFLHKSFRKIPINKAQVTPSWPKKKMIADGQTDGRTKMMGKRKQLAEKQLKNPTEQSKYNNRIDV